MEPSKNPEAPAAGPVPRPEETVAVGLLGPEKKPSAAARILGALGTLAVIIIVPLCVTVGFGIYSSVRPEKILSTQTPKNFGLEYVPTRFPTSDGVSIAGWYIPAEDPESRAAVLVLHGYPADKGDLLGRSAFLQKKFNLLLIDFRYFGESGGKMTTAGARETEDALAALKWLREEKGMSRIGMYGFSMGGAVALMTLPKTDLADAAVSEAAYANLRLMAEELYRYLGPFRSVAAELTAIVSRYALGIDLDAVSPARAVAGTKKPILLVHSKNDKVIPFENAELIRDALAGDPNAEFSLTEGYGHGEASAEFSKIVDEFFTKHLLP